MTTFPSISVCMPMYNASPFLRECIDSILSQTFEDFELLIVDDGSSDDSRDIVRSYTDSRIRLIENSHDYIGSLNLLLESARGKYIARMDADDIMMPFRLKAQFGYMEKHPDVDVLGGGMQQFGKGTNKIVPHQVVTMQDMINACCMAHPTVMIRTDTLRKSRLLYEHDYQYAEDYRLWMQLFKAGAVFRNLNVSLIRYRISDSQVSSLHSSIQMEMTQKIKNDGADWFLKRVEEVSLEDIHLPLSSNQLTVVIPFLNEREEVRNTVRSIRNFVGRHVDIIVVNDHSDDGYDYESDLQKFHVTYINNPFRIGAAASKEKGARLVRTPYFLLLDAHMRCYTHNWHTTIIEKLQADDHRLLCCQTKVLEKDKHGRIRDIGGVKTEGAYASFDYQDYIPGIHWNVSDSSRRLPEDKIPCVLGAGYAASKAYWEHIRGLEGLMHYGSEEAYISLKAWMQGGGCSFLPDVVFGHVYRTNPPYRIVTAQMYYNLFAISYTLFPTSLQCWATACAYRTHTHVYNDIVFWFSHNKHSLDRLKAYYTQVFPSDFERIIEINDVLAPARQEMARHERNRLPDLLDFVLHFADTVERPYLWDGCMGLLLSLCEYEEYMPSDSFSDLEEKLLSQILSFLTPNAEVPVSFAHGICGIGWGLIYMSRNGLAEDNFEDELEVIDKIVAERSLSRMTDFSFETGVGGILCYVVNRLSTLPKSGHYFDDSYFSELRLTAEKALNSTDDFRTHSYALQVLEYHREDWTILRPKWEDVIDLPVFLSQDKDFWKADLHGATGYFCNLVQTLKRMEKKTC